MNIEKYDFTYDEILFFASGFKPYLIKIKTSSIEVRERPSIKNNKIDEIKNNDEYIIIDEYNDENGQKWGNLKSSHGWIPLKYTQKLKTISIPVEFKPYYIKIIPSSLDVYEGPGINYDKSSAIGGWDEYLIVDECNGEGAVKWGKLGSGSGWISLDYCQLVNRSELTHPRV